MDLLHWILRLYFLLLFYFILISCLGNDTDRLSLLEFKKGITQDPHQVMSSWNDSAHFCMWMGVTCSLRHRQRVVRLQLRNHELVGTISPSVGNLSFLRVFNLSSNYFRSNIPQEFGRLSRLQELDLSHNSLGGEIPNNLSKCLNLISLSLYQNQLTGSIPFQLSSLKKLQILNLRQNNLTGIIPPWIGNFSFLRELSLGENSLYGSIPSELGQLEYISVYSNNLSGVIPPSLYNITSIYTFDVVGNKLHGTIPPNVGQTLPNLRYLMLGLNNFHGPIPGSLSNASKLRWLELDDNSFTGPIPMNLGSLPNLTSLNFGDNKIGSGLEDDLNFITSLGNCSLLEVLNLYDANLGGVLPESIGNLSTHLQSFLLGGNLIHGHLPASISNLVSLTSLDLSENLISGSIPFGVGKLRNLNFLSLFSNKLSGKIPSSLGNLTNLIYLYMDDNGFEGAIPPSFGNCKALLDFNISSNKLCGTIPEQVFTLSSLLRFNVANNSLSGSLSLDAGNLVNVVELVLSFNNFSGEIPNTIASCSKLEYLHMQNNLFHGTIPQSFKSLTPLRYLVLLHNNLVGEIPEFFIHLPFLEYLDLSYNDLDGEVPNEGIFKNASAISVRGNKKLCGGIKELGLPICSRQKVERSRHLLPPKKIIIIAFGVVSFILVAISCTAYGLTTFKKANAPSTSSALEKWKSGASYLEIFKSTNEFSLECLIGTGSFSSVYKGLLSDEETYVAIKVLNLQQKGASESFIVECEALKNMRHRNLIKVVTVCSSIDFQGNDFKAIVFEFMSNGSLEQWLHSTHTNDQQQPRALSFVQRVNIAIDVAFGLEYLHLSYGETIVHCDIKPSNVLLDTDMVAHVGDFGLARFLFNTVDDQSEAQTLSSGLKGSIGYIPLEYGVGGEVSTAGDMYSYGILLLEMFTGKRPTDEMFKDGLSLYEFVASALPDRVLEIVDVSLFSETLEEGEDENGEPGNVNESEEAPVLSRRTIEWKRGECLVSILAIALSCCAPSPKDRAVASDVVKKMISIRDLFMCMP